MQNHTTGSTTKANSVLPGETHLADRGESVHLIAMIRRRPWVAVIVLAVTVGAAGAMLKYMEEDSRRQNALRPGDRSMLASVNPWVVQPTPTPTPPLSKEYIYAGSRLLAVEDAGANAAPPADLAVWRPSSGQWWVLGGQGSQQTYQWGTSGDIPVPGDFDGDGKTDFAVFRSSQSIPQGTWYLVDSSTGNSSNVTFGLHGDKPAVADFDGDGRTDLALFRSSDQTWYIRKSSDSSMISQQFGLSTDAPVPADHDGDGRGDISVWRASNNTFYTLRSSNTTVQSQVVGTGGTGSAVPADYDGDGRADYAVRSGSDWIIVKSANNQTETVAWQEGGDIAVHNDYDGDGKVDIAVWRNSNGTWYIRKSSDLSTRTEQWGTSGDIPVPAYFRR